MQTDWGKVCDLDGEFWMFLQVVMGTICEGSDGEGYLRMSSEVVRTFVCIYQLMDGLTVISTRNVGLEHTTMRLRIMRSSD